MEKKEIVKETSIYFIATIMVSILGFILSLLYSKMFSPYDYGVFSIVYGTYNLITNICSGWIVAAIIRNFKLYEKNSRKKEFYGSFYQFQIFLAIIFIILPNIVLIPLKLDELTKNIFFIFTIIYFFEQSLLIINTMLRGEQNSKQYSINNILNSFLKIVIILFLYYIVGYTSITVITISLLLSEIIQYIYMFRKLKLGQYYKKGLFNFNIIKEMFLYGFPLMGVSLTSWILNLSDIYIIQFFYTSNEVGLYSYAYSLGNSLFGLLIQFIMLGAYPNIVKAWEEKGKKEASKVIEQYLKIYFFIMIPACFGVMAVAKKFFQNFIDIEYLDSYKVFIITCISIAVLGLTQYTNKVWELTKKTKTILLLNIISAILNIILNFIMIPRFTYEMGAVTTLISYIIYLVISIILSRKIMKICIDSKSLLKVICASLIMYTLIMIFDRYVHINGILSLLLEIIIGVIAYIIMLFITKTINKENIKELRFNMHKI